MDQQYASNNPWATYLQPDMHTRRDYYNDESERFHARPYQHSQPPAYQDIFAETYSSEPLPNSKAAFDSTAVNATYYSDTGRYSRSPSNAGSDGILEQALDFTQGVVPQGISHRRLRLPIAIPQVVPGLGQPFSRGYSPELSEHGVSTEEFVKFIDNLNVVSAGSPPLQVVDLAGGVVGMVPIHHAQLISLGIQAVAKVGKAAVSKTRGSMFLSKANAEFFNPRGLRVELVTSDALKVKLRMGSDATFGTNSQASDDENVFERRVAALQSYAAPVTFNVPPPDEQTNVLNKMCAAQQKRVIAKQEKEFIKDRSKHAAQEDTLESTSSGSEDDIGKEGRKLESKMQKEMTRRDEQLDKIERERESKLAKKPKDAPKIERERSEEVQKVEKDFQKEMKSLEEKLARLHRGRGKDSKKTKKDKKKTDRETKAMEKIQWILVESLEDTWR